MLLTGTLTTLQDNTNIELEASVALIVRGNINVVGAGGDLVLQSGGWLYWESTPRTH